VLLSSDSFSAEWSNACVEGSTLDRERAELPNTTTSRWSRPVLRTEWSATVCSALSPNRHPEPVQKSGWAIGPQSRKPRPNVPPIKIVRFSGRALTAGIERPLIEG